MVASTGGRVRKTASGSTRTLGAMIGARGCIHSVTPRAPVAGQLPAIGETT